jgi:hypothetical protein
MSKPQQIAILSIDYDGTHVEAFASQSLAMEAAAEYLKRLCRGHEVSLGTLGQWETKAPMCLSIDQHFSCITTTFQHGDDTSLWVQFTIELIEVRTAPSKWNA